MKKSITSKFYFWIALGVPIFFFLLTLLIIIGDSNTTVVLKCSLSSLKDFMETLKIPFSILGLTFVTVGAAFAYYKIDLSYQQHERQLEQEIHSNYKDFRDEFFMLADEQKYKYKILDIPNSWLFYSLYPNAKKGDLKLIKEFEEMLRCDDSLYGFQCVIDAIDSAGNARSGSKYVNAQYQPIANLFMWFRDIFAFDVKLNMGFTLGLYKGDFANDTYKFISDFAHIIIIINAFEGWRFFDNKKRREWLGKLNKLESIAANAEKIEEYFSSSSFVEVQQYWHRHEFDKITNDLIMKDFPNDLQNDLQAKFYIYETFTNERSGGNNMPEEGKNALASALGISQFLL